MPNKNKEASRTKALEHYYKNRLKRIEYQKEYDKKNKDIKVRYDKKRRKIKSYNFKKKIQHYSQRVHLPLLLKDNGSCQLKFEGCLGDKKLEIHHKKYTKKLEDCLLLCQNCHKKIHRKV